jgi:HEPN domain-containing protein
MKPTTREWTAKAEADFRSAKWEGAAPDSPNWDAVCFHAQQSVEKYLKALLVEAGVHFPKTHDLGSLLDLLLPTRPGWEPLRPALNELTDIGVEARYPGATASAQDAERALKTAEEIRQQVREALGV